MDRTFNSNGFNSGINALGEALFPGGKDVAQERYLQQRANESIQRQQQLQLENQNEQARQSAMRPLADSYAGAYYPMIQRAMPVTGVPPVMAPSRMAQPVEGPAVRVPAGEVFGPVTNAPESLIRAPAPITQQALSDILFGTMRAGKESDPTKIAQAINGIANQFGITMGDEALGRRAAIASGMGQAGAPNFAVTPEAAANNRAEERDRRLMEADARANAVVSGAQIRADATRDVAAGNNATKLEIAKDRNGNTLVIETMRDGTRREIAANSEEGRRMLGTAGIASREGIAANQVQSNERISEGRNASNERIGEARNASRERSSATGGGGATPRGIQTTPMAMSQQEILMNNLLRDRAGISDKTVKARPDDTARFNRSYEGRVKAGESPSVAMDGAIVEVFGAKPTVTREGGFLGMGGTRRIQGQPAAAPPPTQAPATAPAAPPRQPQQAAPQTQGQSARERFDAAPEGAMFTSSDGRLFKKIDGKPVLQAPPSNTN